MSRKRASVYVLSSASLCMTRGASNRMQHSVSTPGFKTLRKLKGLNGLMECQSCCIVKFLYARDASPAELGLYDWEVPGGSLPPIVLVCGGGAARQCRRTNFQGGCVPAGCRLR